MNPNFSKVHIILGEYYCSKGDFERGLPELEWRFKTQKLKAPYDTIPMWRGEDLSNKHILLTEEQGLGDCLLYVRYACLLKAMAGKVTFLCSRQALFDLFQRAKGIDEVVLESSDQLQHSTYDYFISLLSLPYLLKQNLTDFHDAVPYLFPDPVKVEQWQHQLKSAPAYKVGMVWGGNPFYKADGYRSCNFSDFSQLFTLSDISFFSVQKGRKIPAGKLPSNVTDLSTFIENFDDTAAILANMDLLITTDTSVAHLAGGLGYPVWLLLSQSPYWFWGGAGDSTPLYPTITIFRQKELYQWSDVFEDVFSRLSKREFTPRTVRERAVLGEV